MTPLEAGVLMALLALPFHLLVQYQLAKLEDPRHLRRHGVVIVSEDALDGHAESIGRYRDHDVWASVTFKGMLYRFDHILPARKRERLSPRELYLEPGLVYVTD